MAKNRKSKRAPARAGVKRAKAASKRKHVVAMKTPEAVTKPEAVTPAQDTAPRSDAAARPMPFFFWPYEVLRWWAPREAARKGT